MRESVIVMKAGDSPRTTKESSGFDGRRHDRGWSSASASKQASQQSMTDDDVYAAYHGHGSIEPPAGDGGGGGDGDGGDVVHRHDWRPMWLAILLLFIIHGAILGCKDGQPLGIKCGVGFIVGLGTLHFTKSMLKGARRG